MPTVGTIARIPYTHPRTEPKPPSAGRIVLLWRPGEDVVPAIVVDVSADDGSMLVDVLAFCKDLGAPAFFENVPFHDFSTGPNLDEVCWSWPGRS